MMGSMIDQCIGNATGNPRPLGAILAANCRDFPLSFPTLAPYPGSWILSLSQMPMEIRWPCTTCWWVKPRTTWGFTIFTAIQHPEFVAATWEIGPWKYDVFMDIEVISKAVSVPGPNRVTIWSDRLQHEHGWCQYRYIWRLCFAEKHVAPQLAEYSWVPQYVTSICLHYKSCETCDIYWATPTRDICII